MNKENIDSMNVKEIPNALNSFQSADITTTDLRHQYAQLQVTVRLDIVCCTYHYFLNLEKIIKRLFTSGTKIF